MICPNCGAELQEGDVFCCHCGYKLENTEQSETATPTVETFSPDEKQNGTHCPNCGEKVSKEDVFCMRCGYRLQAEQPKAAPNSEPPLNVPVGDAGFVHSGEPEMICRMCGCKIPASSTICPICQQPTVRYAQSAPRVQPIYQTQPQAHKKPFNVFALLGFIFGLLGLLGSLGGGEGVLLAIPGLVLGIIGLVKAKKTGAGKGFALTGIILSSVAIILFVIMFTMELLEVFTYNGTGSESVPTDPEFDFWGNGNLY